MLKIDQFFLCVTAEGVILKTQVKVTGRQIATYIQAHCIFFGYSQ